MAFIGLTDRSFELHYAANVLSSLWLFFLVFSWGCFFFWQPVVQTSKVFTVLIELPIIIMAEELGEAACLWCGAGFASQGKM